MQPDEKPISHVEWFAEDGLNQTVKGWLAPIAGRIFSAILSHQLEKGHVGSVAEIGTYVGKTFIGLALATRSDEKAVGIDLFKMDGLDTAAEFAGNIRHHLPPSVSGRVVARRKNSRMLPRAAWAALLGSPARFVHIDGDHSRAGVINDLELAASYLAEHGVVAIDDFFHDYYPDVTEGVFDFLRGSVRIVPVAVIPRAGTLEQGGSKLICSTPVLAAEYKAVLRKAASGRLRSVRNVELLGSGVDVCTLPS